MRAGEAASAPPPPPFAARHQNSLRLDQYPQIQRATTTTGGWRLFTSTHGPTLDGELRAATRAVTTYRLWYRDAMGTADGRRRAGGAGPRAGRLSVFPAAARRWRSSLPAAIEPDSILSVTRARGERWASPHSVSGPDRFLPGCHGNIAGRFQPGSRANNLCCSPVGACGGGGGSGGSGRVASAATGVCCPVITSHRPVPAQIYCRVANRNTVPVHRHRHASADTKDTSRTAVGGCFATVGSSEIRARNDYQINNLLRRPGTRVNKSAPAGCRWRLARAGPTLSRSHMGRSRTDRPVVSPYNSDSTISCI